MNNCATSHKEINKKDFSVIDRDISSGCPDEKSQIHKITILKVFVKKFVKLNGDLRCLPECKQTFTNFSSFCDSERFFAKFLSLKLVDCSIMIIVDFEWSRKLKGKGCKKGLTLCCIESSNATNDKKTINNKCKMHDCYLQQNLWPLIVILKATEQWRPFFLDLPF